MLLPSAPQYHEIATSIYCKIVCKRVRVVVDVLTGWLIVGATESARGSLCCEHAFEQLRTASYRKPLQAQFYSGCKLQLAYSWLRIIVLSGPVPSRLYRRLYCNYHLSS